MAFIVMIYFILFYFCGKKKVFTNADKVHALEVLKRLGLEDCFEGIICFETLNPPSSTTPAATGVFDIVGHFSRAPGAAGVELPKTPVLCKPSPEAMEQALRIANIDPHRTVKIEFWLLFRDRKRRFNVFLRTKFIYLYIFIYFAGVLRRQREEHPGGEGRRAAHGAGKDQIWTIISMIFFWINSIAIDSGWDSSSC